MTRRRVLVGLLAVVGCGRYHSRVKFSLSTKTPKAGVPFTASLDYMDDTEEPVAFVLLREGVEVDRVELRKKQREASLTADEPGPHSVELRWSDRMIAHLSITVR